MKLIEFNWQPTDRQLRQFAALCLLVLPVVGWMWGGSTTTIVILCLIGGVIAILGMVLPTAVKPIFLALTIIATPIGIVIGELGMLLIYFGVFLPLGLVFRIAKRDPLQQKLDRDAISYWEAKQQPANVSRYFRQS